MSELRQRALELLNGEYSIDDAIANADLPELLQELRVAQIALHLQNDELRRKQDELELAHRKYFDYYKLAPVGYMTLDDKGIIQEANLTASMMLRADGQSIIGQLFSTYIEAEYKQAFYLHLQDVLGGNQAQLEPLALIVGEDSDTIYISIDSKPYTLKRNVAGLLVIMTDITIRHALELQVRATQQRIEDAQRQAKLAYWQHNFETGEGSWSAQFYTLLGHEASGVPFDYKNFLDHVHPDDVEKIKKAFHQALVYGNPINIEVRFLLTPDEVRILNIRSFHDAEKSHPTQELSGIIQDITELRVAQDIALQAEIERTRMEVLRRFIRDASHEFRTPLTVLQASIELTKRKSSIDFFYQRYPRMIAQIERIERILDTMLLSTQLSMVSNIEAKTVPVLPLLQRVQKSLQDKIHVSGKELDLDIPDELPPIKGSEHLLIDAFYEVFYNAIRHSREGDHVKVSAIAMDDKIKIMIHDNGVGVPAHLRERVFEAFYRADEAHTSSGSGLGLTITKQIIDLHDGRIWFEDTQEGTTVVIELPTVL